MGQKPRFFVLKNTRYFVFFIGEQSKKKEHRCCTVALFTNIIPRPQDGLCFCLVRETNAMPVAKKVIGLFGASKKESAPQRQELKTISAWCRLVLWPVFEALILLAIPVPAFNRRENEGARRASRGRGRQNLSAKHDSTLSFNAFDFLVSLDVVWLRVLGTKCHAGHLEASGCWGKGGYKILEAVSGTLVSCILVLFNYLKVFLAVHGQNRLLSDGRVSREIVFPPFVSLVGYRGSTVFHSVICWFKEARFLTTPLLPRLSTFFLSPSATEQSEILSSAKILILRKFRNVTSLSHRQIWRNFQRVHCSSSNVTVKRAMLHDKKSVMDGV